MPVPNDIFGTFRDKIMLFISFKQFVYKYFNVRYGFGTEVKLILKNIYDFMVLH